MLVTGHSVLDGVPYINGKRAIKCDENDSLVKAMGGALAPWKCPECDAHLAGGSTICLNGCHMSAAMMRRFNAALGSGR